MSPRYANQRELLIDRIRTLLLEQQDDDGLFDDDPEYKPLIQTLREASSLNEMADACQKLAWDLPSFLSCLLNGIGFDPELDNGDWTSPRGWDT